MHTKDTIECRRFSPALVTLLTLSLAAREQAPRSIPAARSTPAAPATSTGILGHD